MSAEELQDAIAKAARGADKHLQILEMGGQAPDHPVHPAIPETRYLKAYFCRVNERFKVALMLTYPHINPVAVSIGPIFGIGPLARALVRHHVLDRIRRRVVAGAISRARVPARLGRRSISMT